MNEDQRKWLLDLQSKGVKFGTFSVNGKIWHKGTWDFKNDPKNYLIPVQPIPDIPDWRELCMEMYDKGMKFEIFDKWNGGWVNSVGLFDSIIERYRIPQQPIPEWREEMTEEAEPDPREEIPHRELQIQWHEDMLHHLRTGEPMKKWQCKPDGYNRWFDYTGLPTWDRDCEYRRKPRTVTYWHCVVLFDGMKSEVITGYCKDEVSDQNKRCKEAYPDAKFSPIIETTVEVEN